MEVIGGSKKDAKEMLEVLNKDFADEKFKKLRELFSLAKDGKTFNKIDGKALSGALDDIDLNADDKALLDIVTNTINSNDKHLVEFKNTDDALSNSQLKEFGVHQQLIDALGGNVRAGILGSQTMETKDGTKSLIIRDDISAKDYFNSKTKTMVSNPGGIAGIASHEVFGHGRSLVTGRGAGNQHQDAIRFENLLLRIMGLGNVQRTGEDHGTRAKIQNPSQIPNY